jgi:DNA polymerase-3 subunit epsilon
MHQVIPELLSFIGGRPIVGYYVDFDVAMLDKYVLPFIEAKLPNRRSRSRQCITPLSTGMRPRGRSTICDLRRSYPISAYLRLTSMTPSTTR